MGEVYLAEDTELGRQVAVKVLPEAMAGSADRLERFRREARAVAALDHPNIVTVFNVAEAGGKRLLVMELIQGKSLDRLIPVDGMPLGRLFDIAVPVADALAAAHDRGITHRDLKPANVMVGDDGRVKVLDFGLAKLASEPAVTDEEAETELAPETLTGEGVVMGTAPYMSPEQLQGKPVDTRTDVFSLGVMLYEMATGHRPFKGDTGLELASSILKDTPSTITEIRHDLPRHLGRIIHRCLEKDPERRFQSIKDVRNEMEGLEDEISSGALASGTHGAFAPTLAEAPLPHSSSVAGPSVSGSVAPGGVSTPSRSVAKIAATVGIVALIGGAAWWLGRGGRDEPSSATPERAAEATAGATRSIAVLPFADMSAEKDQEYFTDGMTEELLSSLGKIENVRVPSRTAIFALKGKGLDIEQVGQRLGVETVLEGSVRKAGDRIRISTQLIQVEDGFQLWSETYDRNLEDVFAVQAEIAESIASALRLTLTGRVSANQVVGGTDNPEAYDFFLKGEQYFQSGASDDLDYAIQMFEKAIEIDPEYALAWARLALVRHARSAWKGTDLEPMAQASQRALEIEPRLAEAHATRGLYHGVRNEWDQAFEEFEEAIRLDPTKSGLYFGYANHRAMAGHPAEAVKLYEKALELDPDAYNIAQLIPQIYVSLGDREGARRATERAMRAVGRHLELNPDDLNAQIWQASNLMTLGRTEEGMRLAEGVMNSGTRDPRVFYNGACFYSKAGEIDRALDALEQSVNAGYSVPNWLHQDSDLDNIRDHPRFAELIERVEQNRARAAG